MQIPSVFACGPDGIGLLFLGGIAIGGLTLTVSFFAGFICLFTSKWKMGIWLTSLPVLTAALVYSAQRGLNLF